MRRIMPAASLFSPAARALLVAALPDLQAVYLFGSHAVGQAGADSDLDLAVLAARPLDPLERWEVQESVAGLIGCDVDLVDLRAASDVLRAQVLAHGRVVFDADPPARQAFEAYALSSYALLNEERALILDDVRKRGYVYG